MQEEEEEETGREGTLILVSIKNETRKEGQEKKDQLQNWLYQCEFKGKQNPNSSLHYKRNKKGRPEKERSDSQPTVSVWI